MCFTIYAPTLTRKKYRRICYSLPISLQGTNIITLVFQKYIKLKKNVSYFRNKINLLVTLFRHYALRIFMLTDR